MAKRGGSNQTQTFSSEMEELKGQSYETQEALDSAEAGIVKQREANERAEALRVAQEEHQAELQRVQTEALKSKTSNLAQQQEINQQMQEGYQTLGVGAVTDPSSIVESADVAQVNTTGTEINPIAGQAGPVQTATGAQAGAASQSSGSRSRCCFHRKPGYYRTRSSRLSQSNRGSPRTGI